MNPEDTVLNEIQQLQKDKYGVIALIWGFWNSHIIPTESRMVGPEGKEEWDLVFNGYFPGWKSPVDLLHQQCAFT